ncbi:MAG: ATPase, T2SS/T4P/T4SS family, partial [Pseudomonadota bacterium]
GSGEAGARALRTAIADPEAPAKAQAKAQAIAQRRAEQVKRQSAEPGSDPERRGPVLSARSVVDPELGETTEPPKEPPTEPQGDQPKSTTNRARSERPNAERSAKDQKRRMRPPGTTPNKKPAPKSRLKDLEFVDLYVPLHANGVARYNPKDVRVGEPGNVNVAREFYADLDRLREHLHLIKKEDFSLAHDEVRYRGSRARLANGEHWVCLRRISGNVPTLEELKVDELLLPVLRGLGRRNGLIIVCGGTGQGKSTTANAILADYLDRLGHVAMTIEDPVEFNMSGERGNGGYCFQVEVEDDEAWAPSLKRALRWHPRYMLVGEIRSGAAAAQVLRAATSGHLVITTLHAGSVEKGIQAMIQVAETEIGSRAQELVAEGIAAVLHQTLTPDGPEISYIFPNPSGADPARQYIRAGKLHMLNSFMEQQAIHLANEAAGKNADGTARQRGG